MTARRPRQPQAHPFHQLPAVEQLQRPPGVPAGRHCAWCGKPGGNSALVQAGGRLRAFWLHRPCLRPFIAARGDQAASAPPGGQGGDAAASTAAPDTTPDTTTPTKRTDR